MLKVMREDCTAVESSKLRHGLGARLMRVAALASVAVGAACSTAPTPQKLAPPCAIAIDRFKELEIVDEGVIGDTRSLNATRGPWSFRRMIEDLAPPGGDVSAFVLKWLEGWATTRDFNGFPIGAEPAQRETGVRSRLICPWLQATPANGCDSECATCAQKKLDLAKAPFRLLAIANRMDLASRPDGAPSGPAGEGRMIFGMTNGPADDPASMTVPLTLALEYRLPASLSVAGWAQEWHALGKHPQMDESYKVALETLTNRFTARGTTPTGPNGSSIQQIRTNESYFNWIWQLREFSLGPDGEIGPSTLKNTPGASLNGTPTLQAWIVANADKILHTDAVVPSNMLPAASDELLLRWQVSGVDEAVRVAFVRATCNGCHSSGENPPVDTAFHVSPFRSGVEKLSLFTHNPADPAHDELARRAGLLSDALCTAGGTAGSAAGGKDAGLTD
jgi:hypothetical protein